MCRWSLQIGKTCWHHWWWKQLWPHAWFTGTKIECRQWCFVLFVIVMIVLREVGQLKACMVARFLFSTAIECIGWRISTNQSPTGQDCFSHLYVEVQCTSKKRKLSHLPTNLTVLMVITLTNTLLYLQHPQNINFIKIQNLLKWRYEKDI